MTGNRCHAEGCTKLVASGIGICSRHLAVLPRLLREQLWSYRGSTPAPEVVAAAVSTIAERERASREQAA